MELSASEDLLARLAVAAGSIGQLDGAATALAALDPPATLQWLLRHSPHPSGLSDARLRSLLSQLADAVRRSPELLSRDETLNLLGHYGHLLPPEAALDLAMAARLGDIDSVLERAVSVALERAPGNPGLLRVGASLAAAEDPARAHDLLTRLARSDPTLPTLQYVHTARARLPRTGHPPVRLALLSSFTIDPLLSFLDLECRSLALEPELYLAPFNSWEREMFDDASTLRQFDPEIVFLAVAADDLIPQVPTAAPGELEAAGTAAVERLLNSATRFASWSPALLVVHSLYTAFRDPVGPAAGRDGPSRSEVLARLNARLASGLRELPRAHLLDVHDLLLRRPQGALDNPKMRHLARMRFGEHVLGEVARAYAQVIAPAKGRTRKCVVLDLDNTLWGGIVGEDGPHGIRLGDASPGSEYREFQQHLLSLTERGILLAINSKNNEADALEVIRSHEAMVLREESFSAMRINWDSKPDNMLSLADELGIGLDSLVFVDDSEKERALMRRALPEVLTPELPRDPAQYREVLAALPELQVLAVTDEDRTRTRQYAERRQRDQLRISAQTLDEYLRSLGIVAEMARVSPRTLNRVHQLFQRTNQFNLTGQRYELGTLAERADDPGWRIYTTRVSDRFGDHGLVASALVRVTPDAWIVENFVMSCRVIGYGVEDALLAHLGMDARNAAGQWLVGEFRATAKNAPAKDFYQRNAFVRDPGRGEVERWRRDLSGDSPAPPPWITVSAIDGT